MTHFNLQTLKKDRDIVRDKVSESADIGTIFQTYFGLKNGVELNISKQYQEPIEFEQ